jgi:hypothetical protein
MSPAKAIRIFGSLDDETQVSSYAVAAVVNVDADADAADVVGVVDENVADAADVD